MQLFHTIRIKGYIIFHFQVFFSTNVKGFIEDFTQTQKPSKVCNANKEV